MNTEQLQQVLTEIILEPARELPLGFCTILSKSDNVLLFFGVLLVFFTIIFMLDASNLFNSNFFKGDASVLKISSFYCIIICVLFGICRGFILYRLDSEIHNVKCSEEITTFPTVEHSLDYIKTSNPISVENKINPIVYNPNNAFADQTEFIKSDGEQNVCVCKYKVSITGHLLTEIIYKLHYKSTSYISEEARKLLDYTEDETYIKSITYSEKPEAIQPKYTRTYTPKSSIYANSNLNGVSIQTKEGQEIKISDPQVILSDTCKIVVTYGEPEYQEEVRWSSHCIHVGPYVYYPINYKIYVLSGSENVTSRGDSGF